MKKTTHSLPQFGKAGPYSHIVEVGALVYLSGVIPEKPHTGEAVTESIEAATRQVMDNIGALLAHVGCTHADIVKATIFLKDMADYAAVNSVYATYFTADPPARSAVAVRELPKGMPIEIEVIAVKPS